MGVPGLWEALAGAASLQSLATMCQSTEPISIVAVDISIWSYQCQAAEGGINSALRTFFYRLCRLLQTGLHVVFVFDGPQRPECKRKSKTMGRVADLSAYKRLIQLFGFEAWDAPGEAEAEAARLQALGLVHAVLSEDVDTLLFGATVVYRSWAALNHKGNKITNTPSHSLVYKSDQIFHRCKVDSAGMILVALLSGGDYRPDGLHGCGIKTAVEAARGGFGQSLLRSLNNLDSWREELQRSLRNNAEGHFSRKHPNLIIPLDFPSIETLRLYTHPVVTNPKEMREKARDLFLESHLTVDLQDIRKFTREMFNWQERSGDLKTIRSLAPALLVHGMIRSVTSPINGQQSSQEVSDNNNSGDTQVKLGSPPQIVKICNVRQHSSADHQVELRIEYIPQTIVPLVISQEADVSASQMPEATDRGEKDSQPRVVREQLFDATQASRIWVRRDVVIAAYPEAVCEYEQKRITTARAPADRKQSTLDSFVLNSSVKTSHIQASLSTRKQQCTVPQVPPTRISSKVALLSNVIVVDEDSPSQGIMSPSYVQTDEARGIPPVATRNYRKRTPKLSSRSATSIPSSPAILPVAAPVGIVRYFKASKPPPSASKQKSPEKVKSVAVSSENGSRHIILRKSLPGSWRLAGEEDRAEDIQHIGETLTIDLT